MKSEENAKGEQGFGGTTPVIQVAGAHRVLEREPRELFESGNYFTEVPILFGANKHEGSFILGGDLSGKFHFLRNTFFEFNRVGLYETYLKPNNLTSDSEYLQNKLVPDIIRGSGNYNFKKILGYL